MHILIVTDQHPDSLGGVQVALRLQRRFLERAGHTVTIAAPALHRRGYRVAEEDRAAYIALPSRPITRDREYGLSWPGRRTDKVLARALAKRTSAGIAPVDLVHIQGDFWGALIGLRAARGLGLPVIFTMHNNVDEGTRAVTPLAPIAFAALRTWRRLAVGRVPRAARNQTSGPRGAWRYLAELTSSAASVTAPSQHFADALEQHHVAENVEVTPGGVDDELVASVREVSRAPRDRVRLVWLGRMSHEKRVLEFISALGEADAASRVEDGARLEVEVVLHGAGLLLAQVERSIEDLGLGDRVRVAGPVSYADALAAMRDADALVQTSVGFETQGLTPFEAAALGTPTIFCDPNIAHDVGAQPTWLAEDASVGALARVLRDAVADLAAAAGELRVTAREGDAHLQSTKTAQMVQLYERVLSAQASKQ